MSAVTRRCLIEAFTEQVQVVLSLDEIDHDLVRIGVISLEQAVTKMVTTIECMHSGKTTHELTTEL